MPVFVGLFILDFSLAESRKLKVTTEDTEDREFGIGQLGKELRQLMGMVQHYVRRRFA